MKIRFTHYVVATAVCSALVTTPVLAEKADQLIDVNGMSAGSAERELRNRGFAFVSHESNSQGYDYSYWWDERTDDCVRVEEYRGRVQMINDASDQDCNHHLNSGAKAALGVAAGAAILGAIFGSKHDDDDRDDERRESDREYDRGYTDGLHNASYHNRRGNDEYRLGYEAGVNQRNANLRHHHRRGGYSQVVDFKDLRGARARGAMSDLERRGFTQVDNFTSGDTRYSIQWRPESRQCLQVTLADGKVYDISDIQTHPKCR